MNKRNIVKLRSKSYKKIGEYYSSLERGKFPQFCNDPKKEKERVERILIGAKIKSQRESKLRKESFKRPIVTVIF